MRKVYHKIIQIAGNVITVEADNVANNDLAEVTSVRGTSLAQVIRLLDNKVFHWKSKRHHRQPCDSRRGWPCCAK